MRVLLSVAMPLALLGACSMPGVAAEASRPACTVEGIQSLVRAPIRIAAAGHAEAQQGVPSHCAATGFVEHGTHIGFSVALPDDWNGKVLFFGIGGFGGVLESLQRGIARGYATGTTDTGHHGASLEDATWALNNPAGIVNHYETGVELAAQALKGITAAYYGRVPSYAYFEGCSAGGRQGLVEAQRFPSTFDGIIAAAPAWNYLPLLMSFIENGNEILKSPDNWVPPEAFAQVDRMVLEQCDALDGLKDDIVFDPRECKPDLRALLCRGGQRDASCLTAAQLRTVDKLVQPPFARNRAGYFGFRLTGSERTTGYSWGWSEWFFGASPPQVDGAGRLAFAGNGLPPGGSVRGPNQFVLGEQFFRYIAVGDARFDARSFKLDRDARKLEERLGELINADDADLSRFVHTGGKLLIWHGWSDPAIPAEMAIDLYTRIVRDTRPQSGPSSVRDSVRLFMVPGVQHCGGGTGLTAFDALDALEQWVERGHAPEWIAASQLVEAKPVRSRPLCAHPRVARYRGSGNPDDATSFACE